MEAIGQGFISLFVLLVGILMGIAISGRAPSLGTVEAGVGEDVDA